eukprot:12361406-Prorocentrum_lima.AAC.1
MFDGVGSARVGLDDVLRHLKQPNALQLSCAIELDPIVAAATQRALGQDGNRGTEPLHELLARD